MAAEDMPSARLEAKATHTQKHLGAAQAAAQELAVALGAFGDAVAKLAQAQSGAARGTALEGRLQAELDDHQAKARAAVTQLYDELVFVQALTGRLDDVV